MEQSFQARTAPFDIDALLHPSRAFRHPLDVVRDADMTVAEKRSVLAPWAPTHVRSSPTSRCGLPQQGMSSITRTSSMRCSRSMPGKPRTQCATRSSAGSGADDGATGKAVDAAGQTTATLQRVRLSLLWMGAQGSRAAFAAHHFFLEAIDFGLAKLCRASRQWAPWLRRGRLQPDRRSGDRRFR
jgi:hypothetical protein